MSTSTTTTPGRAYSFTDHSTHKPTVPQPGDRLDREFDAIYRALDALGVLTNAVQHTAQVAYTDLAPDTIARLKLELAPSIARAVRQIALLTDVLNTRVDTTLATQLAVQDELQRVAEAGAEALAAKDQAVQAYVEAKDAEAAVLDSATDAANSANDALLSANQAHLDEQLASAWAEYMPTEIPARFYAHTSITGQHWSSRWWATKAANAFGELSSLYMGALPAPPTTTATGEPIPIGAIYYDTTAQQAYVWTGSGWQPLASPTKALTLTLNHIATAGQTTLNLATPDRNGQFYTISTTAPEPCYLYLNGTRIPRDAPVDGSGDWELTPANNTITFLQPLAAGTLILIDILAPATSLTPGRVQTQALAPFTPIDGTTLAFPIVLAATGFPVAVASALELFVSVDGVTQQPGTDYNVAGSTITFGEAPPAGAKVWGLLYSASADTSAVFPSLDLNFAIGGPLDPRIAFSRTSVATYFNAAGTLTTATSGTPRFDYHPVTHVPRGLLIEEARTNLLLNSATLGTQSVTTTAVAYTLSFYGTGTVTLSGTFAGSLVGAGAFPARNTLTFTPTAGTLTLTVTGSVLNANLEAGAFATSYIPTTAAAVTRVADTVTMPVGAWFDPTQISVVTDAMILFSSATGGGLVSFNNGATTNRLQHVAFNSIPKSTLISGGVSSVINPEVATVPLNVPFRFGGSLIAGTYMSSRNGSAPYINTTGIVMPVGITTLTFGNSPPASGVPLNGYLSRVRVWPRALSSAELQASTL